ncbi:scavenger receptor class B member 1 [Ixodes scapularis]
MWSRRTSVICGVASLLLGTFSVVVLVELDDAYRELLSHELALREGSRIFRSWKDVGSSFDTSARFYFFNVTNSRQVAKGEKPQLQELGPYVYREQKDGEGDDVTEDEGGSIEAREKGGGGGRRNRRWMSATTTSWSSELPSSQKTDPSSAADIGPRTRDALFWEVIFDLATPAPVSREGELFWKNAGAAATHYTTGSSLLGKKRRRRLGSFGLRPPGFLLSTCAIDLLLSGSEDTVLFQALRENEVRCL